MFLPAGGRLHGGDRRSALAQPERRRRGEVRKRPARRHCEPLSEFVPDEQPTLTSVTAGKGPVRPRHHHRLLRGRLPRLLELRQRSREQRLSAPRAAVLWRCRVLQRRLCPGRPDVDASHNPPGRTPALGECRTLALSAQHVVGFNWVRQTAFRVTKDFGSGVWFAAALEHPDARTRGVVLPGGAFGLSSSPNAQAPAAAFASSPTPGSRRHLDRPCAGPCRQDRVRTRLGAPRDQASQSMVPSPILRTEQCSARRRIRRCGTAAGLRQGGPPGGGADRSRHRTLRCGGGAGPGGRSGRLDSPDPGHTGDRRP